MGFGLPFIYLPKIVQLDYVIFFLKKTTTSVCTKTNIISRPFLMRLSIQDWYSEVSWCIGKPLLHIPSAWCPLSQTAPRLHRIPQWGSPCTPHSILSCTSSLLLLICSFMYAFFKKEKKRNLH